MDKWDRCDYKTFPKYPEEYWLKLKGMSQRTVGFQVEHGKSAYVLAYLDCLQVGWPVYDKEIPELTPAPIFFAGDN